MSGADELHRFFETKRSDLVRFAALQLRDRELAEDAVQETMLAAERGIVDFAARSSIKTWVFAILKRKIVDALRSRSPEMSISQLDGENDADLDALFDRKGFWATEHKPHSWADPADSLEQQLFWRTFELCLDGLPENTARVFAMRELLDLDTEEICKVLSISTSNCWVILHRARMRLRVCLEDNWFAASG
jgi:RNA polymerase sigma-70 factor, ECF subfamily